MNNSDLHCQILEAPLIRKNFVKGDQHCNYEKYLIEFINASSWFAKNYKDPFIPPESEHDGQYDANSGTYGLDFKLIASKTMIQAKSIFSYQIIKVTDGVYFHSQSWEEGSMDVTRFPQAIRGMTIEEILKTCDEASKKQGIENDIKGYMKTLKTDKNLLLLFPYRLFYDQKGDLEDDILSVIKECNKDYHVTLKYRASLYPSLDTFFAFFYDYSFVLCKWENDNLTFVEAIPVERSETFMHLILEYCPRWNKKYDVVLQKIKAKEIKTTELQ